MSSAARSSHVSLLRGVAGEPLQGFVRDFIRESMKATLKYPQTQAVIRLAVAVTILDASLRDAEGEILDLYADLRCPRPQSINLSSVSRFVHHHYRGLNLPIPEMPNQAYARLFTHEIEQGFRTIASSLLSCGERVDVDRKAQNRLSMLLEMDRDSKESFEMRAWCDCMRALSATSKTCVRGSLAAALKDLYLDPRQKILHEFLVRGLQREPREKWHFDVIFPYGATVTKMGMAVERRYLDELKMPPIPGDSARVS